MIKNSMLAITLAVGVILAGASVVSSQPEEVLLRYGWVAGEHLQYDLSVHGQGYLVFISPAVAGGQGGEMPVPIVMSMDTVYGYRIKDVDEAGNGTVEMQWEPMHISVDMMGNVVQATVDLERGTIKFNGQEQPLPGVSPETAAEPATMKISPRGKVLEITNPERLMPMTGVMGLGQLDPSQIIRASQAQFPEEPVVAGEQWEQLVARPLPTGEGQQVPQMRSAYTLNGFATINGHPCAKINMQAQMQLENLPVPSGATGGGIGAPAGLTTQINSLQMNADSDLYFDYEAGKLIRAVMNITMNMKMNVLGAAAVQGQQMPGLECEMRDFAMAVAMTLRE